jgi:sugar/nucleoside kinase (ribokinase family)
VPTDRVSLSALQEEAPPRVVLLPSRKVKVVDPIGAADAFVAGFMAALCHGLCPEQGLLWGDAAGNLCKSSSSHASTPPA